MGRYWIELEKIEKQEVSLDADSFNEAVAKADGDAGPNWRPITVFDNGECRDVIGKCEGCRKWIVEGDQYILTSDHVRLCESCQQEGEGQ